MKRLIAKWLGVHQQLEAYEQRCQQLVAQRDAYARQLTESEEQRVAAIALIRTAHRTMNLNGGRPHSQQTLREALDLLEGNK